MENVLEYIKINMPAIISGSGLGFGLVGISSLLGYLINRLQSFFDL